LVTKAFEFVDAGRTFQCSAEGQEKNPTEKWWWFRVSTDARTRYAPFRAASGDTESSVRTRIVAYYDHMLEVRNAPPVPRWNGRPKPVVAVAPGAPAAPVSDKVAAV
jgi:hypothetical protein